MLYTKRKPLASWVICWKPLEKQISLSPFMVIWSYSIFDLFRKVVIVNYNDGIMKPLAKIDRNGLEYYSSVNFESNNTHFAIVLLGYHMGGIPWTHMVTWSSDSTVLWEAKMEYCPSTAIFRRDFPNSFDYRKVMNFWIFLPFLWVWPIQTSIPRIP